jgi:N-acetylglucosamine-6-phosphate deacetylase
MKIFGRLYDTMRPTLVEVEEGLIKSVTPASEMPEGAIGGEDLILAPGLIDIQVNGFAGVSLNSEDVSPEVVYKIKEAMIETGVTAFCPTVTTGSHERMIRSMKAIVEACNEESMADYVVCIHMEGPYISSEDGPRGAHPLEHTRDPSWDEFLQLQEAAEGRIRYVTLAPERPGAIAFIENLADEEILPALGHTGAETEHIQAAIEAGAKLSTHLGNGAHARIRRHPNYIWDQLAADELYASIIPDGHHLPPNVVKCFVRCKGKGKVIGVTDAVFAAGMPPGIYGKVEVREDGRVGLIGTEYLAGSALRLDRGVGNLVRFAGVNLEDAIRMCSSTPARLLGVDDRMGEIAPGKWANLILFEWDQVRCKIEVEYTIIKGEIAFRE